MQNLRNRICDKTQNKNKRGERARKSKVCKKEVKAACKCASVGGKHRHLCNETAWEVKAVEHVEHHQPAPDAGVDEVVPIGAQNHCKQLKKGGVALNYIAQNQETVVN